MNSFVKRLVGGTRDGELVQVYPYQQIIYKKKLITIEEAEALRIDGEIMWEGPDEVYEKGGDGQFHYKRTVNYKPEEQDGHKP